MKHRNNRDGTPPNTGVPIALDKVMADMGIGRTTGWRMRKAGWLRTINICGRHYVPADALEEFRMRAERGEFSREIARPNQKIANARRAASK